MGIITGIKSLLSISNTANNVLDKDNGLLVRAGGWIDDLSYTDAEKAEHKMQVGGAITDFVKTTLEENTERSKTRRTIADKWITVQLFLILITVPVAAFNMELAKFYFQLATCEVMLWGTGSIIVFFFGGYVWGTHIRRKTAKTKGEKE